MILIRAFCNTRGGFHLENTAQVIEKHIISMEKSYFPNLICKDADEN